MKIIGFAGCLMLAAYNAQAIELSLPVDCTLGRNCFIQNYVDQAEGDKHEDYLCRKLTYDKHKGTDFRVATLAQAKHIAVIAAAAGEVKAIRNDQPDRQIARQSANEGEGKECGNGLVLTHEDGWETQYCHMKQGSIKVAVGDKVSRGQALGAIGLSGQTEFPHLHLSVRNPEGNEVDPFNAHPMEHGCNESATLDSSLWDSKSQAVMNINPTGYLASGVADEPVNVERIIEGDYAGNKLSANAAAIVFWALLYGVQEGDILSMALLDTSKEVFVEYSEPVTGFKAQLMQFIGKRHSADVPWETGEYEGLVTLKRGKDTIINESFSFTVK